MFLQKSIITQQWRDITEQSGILQNKDEREEVEKYREKRSQNKIQRNKNISCIFS